jgi:hypothetical protein
MPRTVILGWGSLLWDAQPDFDDQHEAWELDGPELPIEFSRISRSRGGALTLVLDTEHGAKSTVAYASSKRRNPDDAICDLRSREGTTRSNIGFSFANGGMYQARSETMLALIRTWAASKQVDVVVWTDLQSNFQKICGLPFSVDAAMAHLQALDVQAKAEAATYVRRAPAFVRTPLRAALQSMPWFPL